MSHFVVYVLVDGDKLEELGVDGAVEELLKPYCEHDEVEPYDKPCYCVEHGIYMKACDEAKAKTGTDMQQLRETFRKILADPVKSKEWRELVTAEEPTKAQRRRLDELNAEKDTAWQNHIAEYQNALKEAEKRLKADAKPDPECDECNGTGTSESTYNPKSKWDWWVVGGRWSGYVKQNVKPDSEGMYDNEVSEDVACVADVLRKFREAEDAFDMQDITPYSLVTPDGEWHDKGDMGWFGMSSDDKDDFEWGREVESYLSDNPKAFVVGVDCHI